MVWLDKLPVRWGAINRSIGYTGQMSSPVEVLALALGSTATLGALATTLTQWLSSRRHRATVKIRISADGATREIEIKNLNDPAQAESFIRDILSREDAMEGGRNE
ncbi:effector-associated constant component EACC1 [Micromonospora sp. CPCC 205558]|uniref:effector-associated constant component EACC1 n=1 Tax=Micromonospora sp. CPCC 205558 TaxID=3122403 RepID=UPI003FA55FC1